MQKRVPLYEQVEEYLYRLIAKHIDDEKFLLPSEISLALQFNISRTTSRRAIEKLASNGFLTRKKGSGTIISKNLSAEQKKLLKSFIDIAPEPPETKNRNTIATILPDLKSKYMMDIIDGIQSLASKNNWNVVIATSNYDQEFEASLIRNFLAYCNGLIIFPVNKTTYNHEIIKLSLKKFPLVVIDNVLNGVETSSITSANRKTTYKTVQHFINKGKRNIGVISNPFESAFSLLERYRGYRDALNDNDIPVNKSYVLNTLQHYGEETSKEIENFLLSNPNLDLVISFNYEIGLKALKILKRGVNNLTNEDLVIFDEEFENLYELMKYKVSYIKQNPFLVGKTAFSIVLDKKNNPDFLNRHMVIPQEMFLL